MAFSFIIHLTVVETSSFSVDFYRKIFKEILLKKTSKQIKFESDVTVKLPFFEVNQLLVYLLKQPFFSTLPLIEVEQSLKRLTIDFSSVKICYSPFYCTKPKNRTCLILINGLRLRSCHCFSWIKHELFYFNRDRDLGHTSVRWKRSCV